MAYLSGDVGLSTAERARQKFLGEQLHAIGLSIEQAQARGDTAGVARLRAIGATLRAEEAALRAKAVSSTNKNQAAADAGFFGVNTLLAGLGNIGKLLPLALAVGVAGYLFLRRK